MSALKQYKRQEPSADDIRKTRDWSVKLVNSKTNKEIAAIFTTVQIENMRLTAEVNEHRRALGFEPLPIFQP